MGWKDLFRKKDSDKEDLLEKYTLSNLKVGYLVDFDLKTWKVTSSSYYDWGSGDITYEWQLKSFDETIYLEKESDDEDVWSVSKKIPFSKIGHKIKAHIIENDDPPEQIVFEGKTFNLEETGGGHFYKDKNTPGQKLLKWDYIDDSGQNFLTIEQWGESDFEASTGIPVEEYQFTNILPGTDDN